MTQFWCWRRVAVSIGSGLSLGCGLVFPSVWWLMLIGLAFFFRLLHDIRKVQQAFVYSWIAGTIKGLIVLSWFYYAYPLEWLFFNESYWQLALISACVVPIAMVFGLGTSFFAMTYVRYIKHVQSWWVVGVMAASWIGGELIGAGLFSFGSMGPGSYLQTYFSFGFVGYALAWHPLLLQLARFGGVYVLSAIVVVIAYGLFRLLQQKRHQYFAVVIICLILTAQISVPLRSDQIIDTPINVALIETSWPRPTVTESAANVFSVKDHIVRDALTAAIATEADYIILPEDSRLTESLQGVTSTQAYLASRLKKPTVVIDSGRTIDADKTVQRAYVYDIGAEAVYMFDKQYLVPQGEFISWLYQPLLHFLLAGSRSDNTFADISYVPGIDQRTVSLPERVPAVLFCFESVRPTGVRATLSNRDQVPFVVHVVSHGWFNRTPQLLWNQQRAMLKVQAVWQQVPILKSANDAPVEVFFPDGSVDDPSPQQSGQGWNISVVSM